MSYDFPGVIGEGTNLIISTGGFPLWPAHTVCIWFRPNVADGGSGPGTQLWMHGDGINWRCQLFFYGGNTIAYATHFTGSIGYWQVAAALIPVVAWKCVVVAHDETGYGPPTIYVYEPPAIIKVNTVDSGLTILSNPSGGILYYDRAMMIGNLTYSGTRSFNGLMSSITAWNRVLSFDEIKTIIYRGDQTVPVGLAMGWDLRNPSTLPAPYINDWTGNSRLGVMGGVTYSDKNPPRLRRVGPTVVV